jgi:beta-lactamase superfamily II metal-dependent hydrolase
MKFTALPVKRGDAFLLRSQCGTVLVDAGQNRTHILKLLKHERITKRHINLLVCTHYDADHINGIIGILESQDFTFDEIWLPEILGSLSYTLSEDLIGILRKLREIDSDGVSIRKSPESTSIDESSQISEDSPIR